MESNIEENLSFSNALDNTNLSNFNSYLQYNCEENSTKSKNSNIKAKEIILDDKLNSIDIIDQNFEFENYSLIENEIKEIGFDEISSIKIDNNEESFEINSSIKYLKNEYYLITHLEKLTKIVENFDNVSLQNIKKPIIKCLLGENRGNNNRDCNNIPIINKNKNIISFYCDNHIKDKNMEMDITFLLKNINKIFIQGPRKLIQNNEDDNQLINDIIFLKENIVKYELNISSLKNKIHTFITQIRKNLRAKIQVFKGFLDDYNNKNKLDESFRAQSLKRISNIYSSFLEKLSLYIYFIMIKRLTFEFQNLSKLNLKNKIILLINFKKALEVIEENKEHVFEKLAKKILDKEIKNKKDMNKKVIKFSWIIEFYFEEEMKYDNNKNIFIAINDKGIIAIFSIIYYKNQKILNTDEKRSVYELLKLETIEGIKAMKITKLRYLYEIEKNDNYFLINSMNSNEFGKAIIINIKEKDNVDIKERYVFEIKQIIKDVNGLYSSLEFNWKENNYLLNFYNCFYLWKYNQETKQLEKNIIENQIIERDENYNYGPLIFEESKKLFIIQCFSPKTIIEFYKLIEEDDNNLSFDKINKIIEFKEEESIIKNNNNYYIFKNKYLLLSSGKTNNNSSGGIYTIDLDLYEKISFQKFSCYISINSIIPSTKNNIIIVSSVYNYKKMFIDKRDKEKEKEGNKIKKNVINLNRGRIMSIEIKEEDNKISFKINKYLEGGAFYFINCAKLFLDSYFFTSIYKNNTLIKFYEDEKFSQYFQINK